jgi:hypothetical protein
MKTFNKVKTAARWAVIGLTITLAGTLSSLVMTAGAANTKQILMQTLRIQSNNDSGSAEINVAASSVGTFSFSLKGTILEDVRLPGTQSHSPKCHWASGWNSGHGVDGNLYWFRDTHMWVCPNRHSPTGWAKAGGGMTGRNCGNPVKLHGRPPGPVVNVVTMLRSFSKLHIIAEAQASAEVFGRCPNTDIWGKASASGLVKVVIDQKMVVQAQGNSEHLRVLVQEALKGQGIVMAIAQLHLSCPIPPAVTVTTPGGTSTTVVTQPVTTVTTPTTTVTVPKTTTVVTTTTTPSTTTVT